MRKLMVTFLLLFVLIVQCVMVEASNKIFLQGIEEFYNSEYDSSIKTFDKVINNNTDSVYIDALYYQTLAYIEKNDVINARNNMNLLEELGYDFAMLHWKLGLIYLNKDSQFDSPFYNEARQELEKANILGINSRDFHTDLAMTYQGLGNQDMAVKEFELAISKGGNLADYINLAKLYKDIGEFNKAINTYKQALNIDSNNTSVYLNLGDIYLNMKEYNLAIETFTKGMNIDPSFTAIKFNLALAYYYNGAYNEAMDFFNKVIELNKNHYQAYYYIGRIVSINEDWQHAIYYFNEAVSYNPDYAIAYIALGNIYLSQDNAYKAISQFTTAIEKNPDYPEGHYYLALAYLDLDMKEAAVAELRKTLHLQSDNDNAKKLMAKLMEEE
jgi:tetratricopeptide (TPR) repeat protein